MKFFLLVLVVLLLPLGGLAVLSLMSRQAPILGLQQGKLLACGPQPNCVCSESHDGAAAAAMVAPLQAGRLPPPQAWALLRQVVGVTGGRVVTDDGTYLHAEYTTAWWRFIDDVEIRADAATGILHVRSASRVGHSDLGANRERVEFLRRELRRLSDGAVQLASR